MTSTLLTVPRPGRSRSGIHSSSTTIPVRIVTMPNEMPVESETPWCSTSHGMLPSSERTTIAMLTPNRTSPT